MKKNIASFLLLAIIAMNLAVVPVQVSAATTTVGGSPFISGSRFPVPATNWACSLISPSTATSTAVLSARADRVGFTLVNVSTQPMWAGASGYTSPPKILITKTAAYAAGGTEPLVASFNVGLGRHLVPCPLAPSLGSSGAAVTDTQSFQRGGVGKDLCTWDERGPAVYTGALYAVSESSGATQPILAKLMACELYP
jgi:hypothetical protein